MYFRIGSFLFRKHTGIILMHSLWETGRHWRGKAQVSPSYPLHDWAASERFNLELSTLNLSDLSVMVSSSLTLAFVLKVLCNVFVISLYVPASQARQLLCLCCTLYRSRRSYFQLFYLLLWWAAIWWHLLSALATNPWTEEPMVGCSPWGWQESEHRWRLLPFSPHMHWRGNGAAQNGRLKQQQVYKLLTWD